MASLYKFWGWPPILSEPSPRRQGNEMASKASNLARFMIVHSNKQELDKEGTYKTMKIVKACRTRTATSCSKSEGLSLKIPEFNGPMLKVSILEPNIVTSEVLQNAKRKFKSSFQERNLPLNCSPCSSFS